MERSCLENNEWRERISTWKVGIVERSRGIGLLAPALLILLLPGAGATSEPSALPSEVGVGVFVLNFGDYNVNQGTYTMDFYLFFRWDPSKTPANYSPAGWELMNGDASGADGPPIYNGTGKGDGEREMWYRVKTSLSSEPRFESFPFDTQQIHILVEDAVYNASEVVYVLMEDESGLDSEFVAAGWQVGEPVIEVTQKSYKFGETYSRVRLTVELSGAKLSNAIKALLPAFIFVVVAALAFFIHPTNWGKRVGLGSGVLISAVLFHISQTLALPPLPRLVLFDKVMIAVYLFVLGSLAVTALIAIDEDYWKDSDHTRQINLWGGALTLATSTILLAALVLV